MSLSGTGVIYQGGSIARAQVADLERRIDRLCELMIWAILLVIALAMSGSQSAKVLIGLILRLVAIVAIIFAVLIVLQIPAA